MTGVVQTTSPSLPAGTSRIRSRGASERSRDKVSATAYATRNRARLRNFRAKVLILLGAVTNESQDALGAALPTVRLYGLPGLIDAHIAPSVVHRLYDAICKRLGVSRSDEHRTLFREYVPKGRQVSCDNRPTCRHILEEFHGRSIVTRRIGGRVTCQHERVGGRKPHRHLFIRPRTHKSLTARPACGLHVPDENDFVSFGE